ncbi:Protein kinase protein rad53 [Lithohypha guttulata]|uniref:Serine/threonine-protein kinase ATG1 n=1 Tax=Lithohypha guttulata TaxID=1690604 RepID=A0AAN7T265_9EURO|nr:Protein kinase protein rad53 [Lithohypha guttulata]
MEPSQDTQPTQEATQPLEDPRRYGTTLSQLEPEDRADILCILHANSSMAINAIRATMLAAPEHILQNDDLDGITEESLANDPEMENMTREIALRMSTTSKFPLEGFRFGRSPLVCDILLTEDPHDKLISSVQFTIFVNDQGSLMLEDRSTNGTYVDDLLLKSKDRNKVFKPARLALKHGSIVSAHVGSAREHAKFMIRIPTRNECEELYEQNVRNYLQRQGIEPRFSSIRESSYGNHWNGGAKYNFTGLLGRGAFAEVYRVQTKSEGTVYAAKEIDKRKFIKNGILDVKFDNELLIMSKLRHPNIVEFHEAVRFEHWVYIIMEHVPFGELSKQLSHGRLPESDGQQVTIQTLRALDYLHRQGITHRDIKPDNILVARRDPIVVKLSDFGLSKSVIDKETFLKTFCGTLLYCAPEVYPDYHMYAQTTTKRRRPGAASSKMSSYDSSADMWSFGAVIFHLLAGKAPIIGRGDDHGAAMLATIMTQPVDFEPLRQVNISPTGIDFIRNLLNIQPDLRPTEQACFDHPWLKDVEEILDYTSVNTVDLRPRRLEAVVEANEEVDEELIDDLSSLTQDSVLFQHANTSHAVLSSPQRAFKKPKMTRVESTIPADILYPHLPAVSPSASAHTSDSKTPKLFGEITPSLLKSSGLFGSNTGPAVSPVIKEDLPQIRDQLEQVSMNDFASSPPDAVEESLANNALLEADLSYAEIPIAGSAASLMGAEAQLGQMKMDPPKPSIANPSSAESQIPELCSNQDTIVPQPHEASAPDVVPPQDSMVADDPRRIEVGLLMDDVAFSETQKERQAAREQNARLTTQAPFGKSSTNLVTPTTGMAKTFSTPMAQLIKRTSALEGQPNSFGGTAAMRLLSVSKFTSTTQKLGKLIPVDGSFDREVVPLIRRKTMWGRAPQCDYRFANPQDTRVPKFGMKIIFYAPGIERVELANRDWTKVSGIRTIIATSATRGIRVNGITLPGQAKDSTAAMFGKIYSGDIITIHESENSGAFLKYQVEISFGDSARVRPEHEKPFVVQKEMFQIPKMREQGLQATFHGEEAASALAVPVTEVSAA